MHFNQLNYLARALLESTLNIYVESGMNKELYIHCLKYYVAINMLTYIIK